MPVILAFLIVAAAVIAITWKTYVGYGEYAWYTKIGFLLFLALGWSAPFLGYYLSRAELPSYMQYVIWGLYFLFGFVFYLFIITFVRDLLWMIVDFIRRVPVKELKDPSLLSKANIYTFIITLLVCFYGVYEAQKMPDIKSFQIASPKIKAKTRVVMLSDLHIDTDVSPQTVKKLVDEVNSLNPDAIVMVGDIIDNTPFKLYKQMDELAKLKTKDHVYVTLGNHEFYSGPMDWGMKFGRMGFEFLNNYGEKVAQSGIYIAGIPDINAAEGYGMKINIQNALAGATLDDYVIVLSHTPLLAKGLNKSKVDLQLSGHTHGGQMFPFHYFAKEANKGKLAGFYKEDGVKMYVSRGARYWGPPLRILAPSEITVFDFIPEKK